MFIIDKSRLTDNIRWLSTDCHCPEDEPCYCYERYACHICDGMGHGYLVGWRQDIDGNDSQPIYSSPCSAFEDTGWNEPEERF